MLNSPNRQNGSMLCIVINILSSYLWNSRKREIARLANSYYSKQPFSSRCTVKFVLKFQSCSLISITRINERNNEQHFKNILNWNFTLACEHACRVHFSPPHGSCNVLDFSYSVIQLWVVGSSSFVVMTRILSTNSSNFLPNILRTSYSYLVHLQSVS